MHYKKVALHSSSQSNLSVDFNCGRSPREIKARSNYMVTRLSLVVGKYKSVCGTPSYVSRNFVVHEPQGPLDGSDLSIRHSNVVFACDVFSSKIRSLRGVSCVPYDERTRNAFHVGSGIYPASNLYAWLFQNIRRDCAKRVIEILFQIVKAASFFHHKKVYYEMHTVRYIHR